MNDSQRLLPRAMEPVLRTALRTMPVVVVGGARQTGKSTLVRALAGAHRRYLTLDDVEVEERARDDPRVLLEGSKPITVDEVQRQPDLLRAIKRAVDERREPGRFLLTGSANLLLMRRVAETLAGRAAYLTLSPMTRAELAGEGRTGRWGELLESPDSRWLSLLERKQRRRSDWRKLARAGGYPPVAYPPADEAARNLWFTGYVRTYLERDLRDLSEVSSLVDFRRVMRVVALRAGQIVNQTEVARDSGVSQPTVRRWLDLLETTYQLARLPAYSVNRTKRLIKTPKAYWTDTGLLLHLAGDPEPSGAHLENVVLADLLAWKGTRLDQIDILFWRTAAGDEVDFVIETPEALIPIEVKAARRARLADAEGLRAFRAEYPGRARAGLFLYDGDTVEWLTEGVLAAPWWTLL